MLRWWLLDEALVGQEAEDNRVLAERKKRRQIKCSSPSSSQPGKLLQNLNWRELFTALRSAARALDEERNEHLLPAEGFKKLTGNSRAPYPQTV
jgi:hypothetical protein